MNALKRIVNIYNKLEEYVLVFSLVVTVIIIFYQVIMRFVFHSAPDWTEEITRYIYVWQVWLGASLALKDGEHIRIELISGAFVRHGRLKSKNLLELFILLVWLTTSVVLVVAGFDVCEQLIAKGSVSAGQRIPMVFVYAALPFASAVISLRIVALIATEGKKLVRGGAA